MSFVTRALSIVRSHYSNATPSVTSSSSPSDNVDSSSLYYYIRPSPVTVLDKNVVFFNNDDNDDDENNNNNYTAATTTRSSIIACQSVLSLLFFHPSTMNRRLRRQDDDNDDDDHDNKSLTAMTYPHDNDTTIIYQIEVLAERRRWILLRHGKQHHHDERQQQRWQKKINASSSSSLSLPYFRYDDFHHQQQRRTTTHSTTDISEIIVTTNDGDETDFFPVYDIVISPSSHLPENNNNSDKNTTTTAEMIGNEEEHIRHLCHELLSSSSLLGKDIISFLFHFTKCLNDCDDDNINVETPTTTTTTTSSSFFDGTILTRQWLLPPPLTEESSSLPQCRRSSSSSRRLFFGDTTTGVITNNSSDRTLFGCLSRPKGRWDRNYNDASMTLSFPPNDYLSTTDDDAGGGEDLLTSHNRRMKEAREDCRRRCNNRHLKEKMCNIVENGENEDYHHPQSFPAPDTTQSSSSSSLHLCGWDTLTFSSSSSSLSSSLYIPSPSPLLTTTTNNNLHPWSLIPPTTTMKLPSHDILSLCLGYPPPLFLSSSIHTTTTTTTTTSQSISSHLQPLHQMGMNYRHCLSLSIPTTTIPHRRRRRGGMSSRLSHCTFRAMNHWIQKELQYYRQSLMKVLRLATTPSSEMTTTTTTTTKKRCDAKLVLWTIHEALTQTREIRERLNDVKVLSSSIVMIINNETKKEFSSTVVVDSIKKLVSLASREWMMMTGDDNDDNNSCRLVAHFCFRHITKHVVWERLSHGLFRGEWDEDDMNELLLLLSSSSSLTTTTQCLSTDIVASIRKCLDCWTLLKKYKSERDDGGVLLSSPLSLYERIASLGEGLSLQFMTDDKEWREWRDTWNKYRREVIHVMTEHKSAAAIEIANQGKEESSSSIEVDDVNVSSPIRELSPSSSPIATTTTTTTDNNPQQQQKTTNNDTITIEEPPQKKTSPPTTLPIIPHRTTTTPSSSSSSPKNNKTTTAALLTTAAKQALRSTYQSLTHDIDRRIIATQWRQRRLERMPLAQEELLRLLKEEEQGRMDVVVPSVVRETMKKDDNGTEMMMMVGETDCCDDDNQHCIERCDNNDQNDGNQHSRDEVIEGNLTLLYPFIAIKQEEIKHMHQGDSNIINDDKFEIENNSNIGNDVIKNTLEDNVLLSDHTSCQADGNITDIAHSTSNSNDNLIVNSISNEKLLSGGDNNVPFHYLLQNYDNKNHRNSKNNQKVINNRTQDRFYQHEKTNNKEVDEVLSLATPVKTTVTICNTVELTDVYTKKTQECKNDKNCSFISITNCNNSDITQQHQYNHITKNTATNNSSFQLPQLQHKPSSPAITSGSPQSSLLPSTPSHPLPIALHYSLHHPIKYQHALLRHIITHTLTTTTSSSSQLYNQKDSNNITHHYNNNNNNNPQYYNDIQQLILKHNQAEQRWNSNNAVLSFYQKRQNQQQQHQKITALRWMYRTMLMTWGRYLQLQCGYLLKRGKVSVKQVYGDGMVPVDIMDDDIMPTMMTSTATCLINTTNDNQYETTMTMLEKWHRILFRIPKGLSKSLASLMEAFYDQFEQLDNALSCQHQREQREARMKKVDATCSKDSDKKTNNRSADEDLPFDIMVEYHIYKKMMTELKEWLSQRMTMEDVFMNDDESDDDDGEEDEMSDHWRELYVLLVG